MSEPIERPVSIQVNAWTGLSSPSDTLPKTTKWAQRENIAGKTTLWLAPAAPVDTRDWSHPSVGWGLILPDNDTISQAERARGEDAPEPIKQLLKSRPGSPVLRYRPELQQGYLRRYYENRAPQDLSVQAPRPGMAEGCVPQYLLIYGTPEEIPWAVQYALNMSTFVGRLDLGRRPGEDQALNNYVTALIGDWTGQTCHPRTPVVWSTDHGSVDITWLMARAVAGRIWDAFKQDADLQGSVRLNEAGATGTALATALAERSPALIVTTSHGMTGPLNDANALKASLGNPVDALHQPLGLAQLTDWKPSGAIWYAHACCSAGSDSESRYQGLLPESNAVAAMLDGVAKTAGATVAPLPRALLGLENPLRAFVGHVEPTFDWTLRDPINKQVVTHIIQKALYDKLYQQDRRTPIGFALQGIYQEAGQFYGAWQSAVKDIDNNVPGMRDWALYRQLVAMDRQTLVIIGDPTVSLPSLGA
jgi:hypothetical protein